MKKSDHRERGVPTRHVPTSAKPQVLERIEPYPEGRRSRSRMKGFLIWLGALALVLQLTLPDPWKPFTQAGMAVAGFHGELMDEVNRKDLELEQQRAIAQRIADLQADYATWKGLCALSGTFDPRVGQTCLQAADAHFQNALRQIRKSELNYR